MAAIEIRWSGLLEVAEVSLAFGAGVVIVFTLGVLGLSKAAAAREAPSGSRSAGIALAALAFAACAAAVGYGLYLLIPQFHK